MDQLFIRNFCIIAHIDHGKSTLADRLLQATSTIAERDMMSQVLDTMDLEREKGVTIKASAVRMRYTAADGQEYEMNLIDTPGHVDFAYEVSRALQACEGAVLVVDATQGVEAQTLANLYLAMENDLEVIPIVNKIDLVSAQPDVVAQEIEEVLGTPAEDILRISAKEGTNIRALLDAVVEHVPPPHGQRGQSLRALIFDSHYDAYKGVIAYVRVVDGVVETGQTLRLMSTGLPVEPLEIGYFGPDMRPDRPVGGRRSRLHRHRFEDGERLRRGRYLYIERCAGGRAVARLYADEVDGVRQRVPQRGVGLHFVARGAGEAPTQ